MTAALLLDNSAWVRRGDNRVSAQRADELADGLESGRIATCLPFLLEAGYSTRTGREHDELLAELLSLPHYRFDEAAEQRALDAQAQLARASAVTGCVPLTCSSPRSPTGTDSASSTTTTITT